MKNVFNGSVADFGACGLRGKKALNDNNKKTAAYRRDRSDQHAHPPGR